MSEIPEIGKISAEIFAELIFPRLGAKSDSVLVGPKHGTDVGIVTIGGKAVSFTTDPVFIVPEYGWERAAWFAIHILASDAVTCGLPPRFLSIDLNLPMEMTKEQLEIMWQTMHSECQKLGVSVITGHTARYENCYYPMVGGATVVGVGEMEDYVTPAFIQAGDEIFLYDKRGNLTKKASPAKTAEYEYDYENRLIKYSDGVSVVEYEYNGDGIRLSKTVNGDKTIFLNDVRTPLTQVLMECTGNWYIKKR